MNISLVEYQNSDVNLLINEGALNAVTHLEAYNRLLEKVNTNDNITYIVDHVVSNDLQI